LTGESEVAQQVAAVWRDLDIENRVARKKIGKRRADLCFGRQNQKARRIFAQIQLDWAEKHSFALNAAEVSLANFNSVGQLCARQRERNFVSSFVSGRAANDVAIRSKAVIDFANRQGISVRMSRRGPHLRDN